MVTGVAAYFLEIMFVTNSMIRLHPVLYRDLITTSFELLLKLLLKGYFVSNPYFVTDQCVTSH